MSNTRLVSTSLSTSLLVIILSTVSGCADSASPAAPDAAVPVPIDPAGHYLATSAFALPAPPDAAAAALAELAAMSDGPDDPSRYLIDLMIDKLPDGSTKTYATAIAPFIAAYVNLRIATIAPRFVDGTRALSGGLSRVAQRFGTTELIDIADDGPRIDGDGRIVQGRWLERTIVGARFELHGGRDVADVRFAPLGLPDLATRSVITLDAVALGSAASARPDRLAIVRHTVGWPYAKLLRLAFDLAVLPDVAPGAHDLGQALVALVDCNQLGAIVADYIGVGSPSFYASACSVGLAALATRLYARLDAIDAAPLPLELAGEARAVDDDRDGTMDAIAGGTWTGTLAGTAVTGSFAGSPR